jgi:phosphonoacetate hydrolase
MPNPPLQKTAVFMIDGFDIDYYYSTDMPRMQHMARDGFFKAGSCIFPSLTNANNISIACGCWPESHGVTTNCYYDQTSNRAFFLEGPDFLHEQTIFEISAEPDSLSALLTCKSKTAQIIGHQASITIAAEAPDEEVIKKYGTPPPMYSAEINYWLFNVAIDLVRTLPNLNLIYIHTTDYPMHMWPPEAHESQEHLKTLDEYFGIFHEAAPEFAIAITADHGMNAKKRCWDLSKACSNRGVELKFAVSPVADRLIKHHGGHGGVSYVYLKTPKDRQRVIETLMGLVGIENVLERDTAAKRFSLMASRIGDLVVLPDRDTVFGDLSSESEVLPLDYRSHGSLYEMEVPLLLFNSESNGFRYQELNYNLDLTRTLFKNRGA